MSWIPDEGEGQPEGMSEGMSEGQAEGQPEGQAEGMTEELPFSSLDFDGNNLQDMQEFYILQTVLENNCLYAGHYGVANATALAAWDHNLQEVQSLLNGATPIQDENLPEYNVSETVLTAYINPAFPCCNNWCKMASLTMRRTVL